MSGRCRSAATLLTALLLAGCEKATHRAASAEFQGLMARALPPAEQARALEAFVQRYPEPKTNPYLTRAETLLADYHARAGEIDIAASWYERAVRASPGDPDLLNSLGYLYASHGVNLDRAVTVLESAVHLAEERGYPPRRLGFIKDSLGWAHRMRGDYALAVAILEEAVRLAPGVSIIRSHLADGYRIIGEREKAVAIFLDLLLETRATDTRLRQTLEAVGREGGPLLSRDVARRLGEGLNAIAEADRRAAEAQGATFVEITAADGARIAGSLFVPPAPARRSSVVSARTGGVLLLHALASSRQSASSTGRILAARGLVALAIDLRGHGASVSEALPGPRQFREHLAENIEAAGRDAVAGLDYLRRMPRVDPRRLGLVGAGLGALLAARAADDTARRGALALISPWGRADAYQPHVDRLDSGSLLLIRGADEVATAGLVDLLARGLGAAPRRTIVVAGPGTGYDLLDRDAAASEALAAFFAERLLSGAPLSPPESGHAPRPNARRGS